MADKKTERRGLGRGLSALMADVAPADAAPSGPVTSRGERLIPVEQIQPNADQPRRDFSKDALEDLTNSIREKGIIQPLILRENPNKSDSYQIVAGERRWRAAQAANLHEVPAIIRDYDETELLEIAIIENIQRSDLNPVEEAAGYRSLMDKFGHTQERIAEALGKSRSHIANLLRLLNLPDPVLEMLKQGDLSAGHARALVTADEPVELAKRIVKNGLSVRETERLAKPGAATKPKGPASASAKDADTLALEGDLSAMLNMKVAIAHKAGGEAGQVSISYKSLEDLDKLCNLLSGTRS